MFRSGPDLIPNRRLTVITLVVSLNSNPYLNRSQQFKTPIPNSTVVLQSWSCRMILVTSLCPKPQYYKPQPGAERRPGGHVRTPPAVRQCRRLVNLMPTSHRSTSLREMWKGVSDNSPLGHFFFPTVRSNISISTTVIASVPMTEQVCVEPAFAAECLQSSIHTVSRRQQITLRATLIFHLIDALLSTTAAHEVRRAGVLTCGSCHLERSARPHPHRA